MFADEGTIRIKHDVLLEVAKLAFAGELEEKRDQIPYTLMPGPKPQTRCCVYKEREIIRQRVRLAEGKSSGVEDDGNIMQVVSSACEDCPISSYIVTDNCQNCAGKACINSCHFGAISIGDFRSKIDASKCRECGMCAQACPYNAIAHLKRPCKFSCPVDAISYDENGISVIDEAKCIRCGHCIHKCPFGAISSKSFIVNVIRAIKSDKPAYVMFAPSAEGQYGKDISMASIREAMKKLGFTDMIEVASGADMTAASEGEEWLEAHNNGQKKTTSCCPAFVNMVNMHFPELSDKVSSTVSPMCAVSRMIKEKEPDAFTVFVGPCIAKKSEVVDHKIEGNADAVLTFSELHAIMRAKDISFEPVDDSYQTGSIYGKRFASSGGVTGAVLEYIKEAVPEETEINVCKANGSAECKKALLLLKNDKLPEEFIEGMICEGGCVGGPSSRSEYNKCKRDREALLANSDSRSIIESIKQQNAECVHMHR